jgi:hypothetical protein
MMRQELVHLGGSCGGVSNKAKSILYLTVIGQKIQCKPSHFASCMPLHTAIFRRADSSQKANCVQKVGFTDLYFIKAEFSAIFLVN